MQRAYSLLEVKGVDHDLRRITGIASTPTPDRSLDIVDPIGAKYAAQIPFLWQHEHSKPIGFAALGKATKAGIPFTAEVARIDEDGPLKQLLDMAWQSIKAKLVRGVSIGFRSIAHEYLENVGIRFNEYEIYELSAVTVPANAEATIQTIKMISHERAGAIQLINPVKDSTGAVRLIRT